MRYNIFELCKRTLEMEWFRERRRLTCLQHSSKWTATLEILSWNFCEDEITESPLWQSDFTQIRRTLVGPSAYISYPTFIISGSLKFLDIWLVKPPGSLDLNKGFHVRNLSKLISRRLSTSKFNSKKSSTTQCQNGKVCTFLCI